MPTDSGNYLYMCLLYSVRFRVHSRAHQCNCKLSTGHALRIIDMSHCVLRFTHEVCWYVSFATVWLHSKRQSGQSNRRPTTATIMEVAATTTQMSGTPERPQTTICFASQRAIWIHRIATAWIFKKDMASIKSRNCHSVLSTASTCLESAFKIVKKE